MDDLYLQEKFKNIDKELHEHEQRIVTSEKRINETDKKLAVSMENINGSLNSLSRLPEIMSEVSGTISKMGTTMELMQAELRGNTEKISELREDISNQNERIDKIDNESKLNFRTWVVSNAGKILVGALAAAGALFIIGEIIITKTM